MRRHRSVVRPVTIADVISYAEATRARIEHPFSVPHRAFHQGSSIVSKSQGIDWGNAAVSAEPLHREGYGMRSAKGHNNQPNNRSTFQKNTRQSRTPLIDKNIFKTDGWRVMERNPIGSMLFSKESESGNTNVDEWGTPIAQNVDNSQKASDAEKDRSSPVSMAVPAELKQNANNASRSNNYENRYRSMNATNTRNYPDPQKAQNIKVEPQTGRYQNANHGNLASGDNSPKQPKNSAERPKVEEDLQDAMKSVKPQQQKIMNTNSNETIVRLPYQNNPSTRKIPSKTNKSKVGFNTKDFFRATGNGWTLEYRNRPISFDNTDNKNAPVDAWGTPIVSSSIDAKPKWIENVSIVTPQSHDADPQVKVTKIDEKRTMMPTQHSRQHRGASLRSEAQSVGKAPKSLLASSYSEAFEDANEETRTTRQPQIISQISSSQAQTTNKMSISTTKLSDSLAQRLQAASANYASQGPSASKVISPTIGKGDLSGDQKDIFDDAFSEVVGWGQGRKEHRPMRRDTKDQSVVVSESKTVPSLGRTLSNRSLPPKSTKSNEQTQMAAIKSSRSLSDLVLMFGLQKSRRVAQYTSSVDLSASLERSKSLGSSGSTSWLLSHSKTLSGTESNSQSQKEELIDPIEVANAYCAAEQWQQAIDVLLESIAETGTVASNSQSPESKGNAVVSGYVAIDKPFPSTDGHAASQSPIFSPLRSSSDKVSLRFGLPSSATAQIKASSLDDESSNLNSFLRPEGTRPLFNRESSTSPSHHSGSKGNIDATRYVGALVALYARRGMWRDALAYIGTDMITLNPETTAQLIDGAVGGQKDVSQWVGLVESIYFGYIAPYLQETIYGRYKSADATRSLPMCTGLTTNRCRELLYASQVKDAHRLGKDPSADGRASIALALWNTYAKRLGQSTVPMVLDVAEGLLMREDDVQVARSFLLPLFFSTLGLSVPLPPTVSSYADLTQIKLDEARYVIMSGICNILDAERLVSEHGDGKSPSDMGRLVDACENFAELWATFVPSIARDRQEKEHLRTTPLKMKPIPPTLPRGNVPAPVGSFFDGPLTSPLAKEGHDQHRDSSGLPTTESSSATQAPSEAYVNELLDKGDWEAAFEILPAIVVARSEVGSDNSELPILKRLSIANHVLAKALSGSNVANLPLEALETLVSFAEREGLLEVAADGCLQVDLPEQSELDRTKAADPSSERKVLKVFSEGQRQSLIKSLTRILQALASMPSEDARLLALTLFVGMGAANDGFSVAQALYVLSLMGKDGGIGSALPLENNPSEETTEFDAATDARTLWEALSRDADASLINIPSLSHSTKKIGKATNTDQEIADANARRAALLHCIACYKSMCAQPSMEEGSSEQAPFLVRNANDLNDPLSTRKLFSELSVYTRPGTVAISGLNKLSGGLGDSNTLTEHSDAVPAVPSSIDLLFSAFPRQSAGVASSALTSASKNYTPLAKALFPHLAHGHTQSYNLSGFERRIHKDTVHATARTLRLMAWDKDWPLGLDVCAELKAMGEGAALSSVLGLKIPYIPQAAMKVAEDLLNNNNGPRS